MATDEELVKLIEDVIDDTSDYRGGGGYYACSCRTTGPTTAPAIIAALREAGIIT